MILRYVLHVSLALRLFLGSRMSASSILSYLKQCLIIYCRDRLVDHVKTA